jgi:hypothetical protein
VRHAAGEHHGVGDAERRGERLELLAVPAGTDQQQDGVAHPVPDEWQRVDERVLSLAWHEPRHAHDHRPVLDAVTGPDGRAVEVRAEQLAVDAAGQSDEFRRATQGARQPGAEVLREVGDDVAAVPDAAQRLPGAGQHRPACLVAVCGGDDALGAGRTQRRGEQPERRGRTEPHRGTAEFLQRRNRAATSRRRRHEQPRGVAQHGERLRSVECGRAAVVGRVDDDRARRLPGRKSVHERLDAALPRREVVRHDQRVPCCGQLSASFT